MLLLLLGWKPSRIASVGPVSRGAKFLVSTVALVPESLTSLELASGGDFQRSGISSPWRGLIDGNFITKTKISLFEPIIPMVTQ